MSRKTWISIFAGVGVIHAILFMLVKDDPAVPPKWFENTAPPDPTFTHGEAKYTDPETGERMVVKEFTVPTKLAGGRPGQKQEP
ncbi:MAG TPA: hypothetical protein VIT91_05175 [Chthoniobacterales bacterium]